MSSPQAKASRKNRPVLDPRSEVPRFRQIQDHILAQIDSGKLAPGQRLPSLRPWAAEIGVAYETMSKAVRDLVSKGILNAAPRRGTTVAARGPARGRAGAVGVVSYGPLTETGYSRYYSALIPMVQDELMARHERIIFERWVPGRPMTAMFQNLQLVDGVMLLGNVVYPAEQIRAVERLCVPVMCVGGIQETGVCVVRGDDVADCRHAVGELVRMGHSSIA
ncbi:MAG TPA: GntR family transcriptional regulator, partial [Candidatus Brocadiia bacterium]|nr:GntR family transcriptional regulator [Candidatus Brocadiia bacterium]